MGNAARRAATYTPGNAAESWKSRFSFTGALENFCGILDGWILGDGVIANSFPGKTPLSSSMEFRYLRLKQGWLCRQLITHRCSQDSYYRFGKSSKVHRAKYVFLGKRLYMRKVVAVDLTLSSNREKADSPVGVHQLPLQADMLLQDQGSQSNEVVPNA